MSNKKEPTKEICDWSKQQLRDHFDLLARIVTSPAYGCVKCGRVANERKWLCKPKKLPQADSGRFDDFS